MRAKQKILFLIPIILIFSYFFIYPLIILIMSSLNFDKGLSVSNYVSILTKPYYFKALLNSVLLAVAVTFVSLVIAGILAFFMARTNFRGKALYLSVLTFPISFPGVVVGFMIIILFGATGILPDLTQRLFGVKLFNVAYTIVGVFLSYLYFQIPRTFMSLYGTILEYDISLEEAARTLGASEGQAIRHVILPSVLPVFVSAGALAFSTSMSAFGTAFTLANQFSILPILMYNEFTMTYNVGMASAISIVIGVISIVMNYVYKAFLEREEA